MSACALATAPGASLAGESFVKVIPPGHEKLLAEMLGAEVALSSGCRFSGAAVDRTRIIARYLCGDRPASVELHHPGHPEAAAPAARTAEFALVAGDDVPRALVDELAGRVAARESGWRWVSAEAPGLAAVPDGPTPTDRAALGFSPEESEAFLAGVKLYREHKPREAFERFRALARTTPQNGVLGMVVASLASTELTPEAVDRFTADADASPGDTLAQFIAGVAAHYAGHRVARTRPEKAAYYQRAITYLSRTRPTYDFEPRVYVYLGVSHFRLGHQEEAERLIEAAIPLAKNDPDVYYCRGEIFQRTNPSRSVADLRTYLEMIAALAKQGVPIEQNKLARVEKMLSHLEAVGRGEAQAQDLFDPLPEARAAAQPPPPPHHLLTTPRTFAGAVLVTSLIAAGAWAMVLRRKRRSGS